MKLRLLTFLTLITMSSIHAQIEDDNNRNAAPAGGINQFSAHYLAIEFTKAQREQLEGKEIELHFLIAEDGKAVLTETNGVTDPAIIDSLTSRTLSLDPFLPQIRDGEPVESLYFLRMSYPSYNSTNQYQGLTYFPLFRKSKYDDFEYIIESGRRIDVLFSAVANNFLGSASEYLSTGAGVKIDVNYNGANKIIYGFNTSIYSNRRKLLLPIESNREQFSNIPTLVTGLVIGRWFDRFSLQAELNLMVQNITDRIDNNDRDWIQLNGWSPGLVINYPIQIGKLDPEYYYLSPSLIQHNLNLHFGLRYLDSSLSELSSLMMEIGVGYRLSVKGVDDFQLKNETH